VLDQANISGSLIGGAAIFQDNSVPRQKEKICVGNDLPSGSEEK
jgi:hypothetical protein